MNKFTIGQWVIDSHGEVYEVEAINEHIVKLVGGGQINENFLFANAFAWFAYHVDIFLKRALGIQVKLREAQDEK